MKKKTWILTGALLLALAAVLASCAKAPPPAHLDGLWYVSTTDTAGGLGRYDYTDIWIISEGSYYQYAERISEFAMHWQSGSRGKIDIKDKAFTLIPRETTGQMSDWEPVEKGFKIPYDYTLNGDELSLDDHNGGPFVLRKSPWRYKGSMSGAQELAIRLTIDSIAASGEVSGAYYQYFNARRNEYRDPIILTGRLEAGTLILYETEPKDPAIKRASMTFPEYSALTMDMEGVWQDLRAEKESNKFEMSLYLDVAD